MNAVCFNGCAIKGFDRSSIAEIMVNEHEARIKSSSVFSKAKVSFTKFRHIEQINRVALNSGFFVAVTTTKDSLLNSAGCGVKIGDRLPLGICLAALVERLHNLFGLSGKMSKLRNELTRHAHLVLVASKARMERKAMFVSIAPLSNLLSKIN